MRFIELLDSDGLLNLFQLSMISKVYEGGNSGELHVRFTKESNLEYFKTSKETLESFKEKVNAIKV